MTSIVYATTNPGKFEMVKAIFNHHGSNITSLSNFNIRVNVDETGTSLEENARIKAETYAKLLPADSIVIGDDTGIEIDALGGEPGIKVRRWDGTQMSDEAIIDLCLSKLKDVKKPHRTAHFRTVLAVAIEGKETQYFEGIMHGEILETPKLERAEGMPFWPIFYLPDLKMTLGEFHAKPIKFQLDHPTHREKAVLSALPYLAKLI
jgi:XTP/dITP diphosphohydrolase